MARLKCIYFINDNLFMIITVIIDLKVNCISSIKQVLKHLKYRLSKL